MARVSRIASARVFACLVTFGLSSGWSSSLISLSLISLSPISLPLVSLPLVSPALAKSGNRGEALFRGREPLDGTIRGHQSRLPAEVVRCHNCHARGKDQVAKGTSAPRIDRSLLLESRPRRGGPPSSYDEPAFCKLLRTGVDPAFVLIAREMPVYDVTDAQCAHLWRFLTED